MWLIWPTLKFRKAKKALIIRIHPELASLSELAADFPAEERPLISNFGEKISVIDDSPLAKVDIDNAVLGELKPIEHNFLYKLLLSFSLLVMTSAVAGSASLISKSINTVF